MKVVKWYWLAVCQTILLVLIGGRQSTFTTALSAINKYCQKSKIICSRNNFTRIPPSKIVLNT